MVDVVKVFNEYVPPDELLHVDRCQHLERAIKIANREIPAENLLFAGLRVTENATCVPIIVCVCTYVFMIVSLSFR